MSTPDGPDRPEQLLAWADTVLTSAPSAVGADRTLAAAILVRQAIEVALADWWAVALPTLANGSGRDQLVSLPFYLDSVAEQHDEPGLAGAVTWTWNRLSRFCHHRSYELAPAEAEIRDLMANVARFEAVIAAHRDALAAAAAGPS